MASAQLVSCHTVHTFVHLTTSATLGQNKLIYVPGMSQCLPWVKELLCGKGDLAVQIPTASGHTRCRGDVCSHLLTLVPQKWVRALTSTVPSALNCSHAVCGENAQISNSSLYWWCYFWSSWHKWAWLCKIEVSNQLAPTNGLCSFLLPLSKAQIWGWSDSGIPWTLAKHAWPRHRCEKKVPIPWRQRYKLKNILQRKYNHGKLQQRCYSENLLFPPPTARETPF